MPLLILFAGALAVRGLMISPSTDPSAIASPLEGLNFVWEPKFTMENANGEQSYALLNPTVWLAAAGTDLLHAFNRHGLDALLCLLPAQE